MDDRIDALYTLPETVLPRNARMEKMKEQCICLEDQLLAMGEKLPVEDWQMLKAYIALRDELDVLLVRRAMKFGKLQKK